MRFALTHVLIFLIAYVSALLMEIRSMYIFHTDVLLSTNDCMAKHVGAEHGVCVMVLR